MAKERSLKMQTLPKIHTNNKTVAYVQQGVEVMFSLFGFKITTSQNWAKPIPCCRGLKN